MQPDPTHPAAIHVDASGPSSVDRTAPDLSADELAQFAALPAELDAAEEAGADGMEAPWIVWSNEHRAFWAPNRHGYTGRIEKAGRYSKADAEAICKGANYRANSTIYEGTPPEICMHAPEALTASEAARIGAETRAEGMREALDNAAWHLQTISSDIRNPQQRMLADKWVREARAAISARALDAASSDGGV